MTIKDKIKLEISKMTLGFKIFYVIVFCIIVGALIGNWIGLW